MITQPLPHYAGVIDPYAIYTGGGRPVSQVALSYGVARCTDRYRPERKLVERVTRIELALSAWEADVLPLNYTRDDPGAAGRRLPTSARAEPVPTCYRNR